MPDESSLQGLLALMLLTDARRETRADAEGELVLIVDQDRSRWDPALIAEGAALVDGALRRSRHRAGRFELEAAIAACHATAKTYAETDWTDIIALYDRLLEVAPTDVVRLNRAVAIGERDGREGRTRRARPALRARPFPPVARLPRRAARRLGGPRKPQRRSSSALACQPPAVDRRHLERRIAALHS